MRDDDDGQVDGDAPYGGSPFVGAAAAAARNAGAAKPTHPQVIARSPFAENFGSAPWLEQQPPWLMWGNTVTITTLPTGKTGNAQQLIKVAYKRPESWHWLFTARLVDAPDSVAANDVQVRVRFNLTIGVGRAMVQMHPFDFFQWMWGSGQSAPTFTPLWATSALTPALNYVQVAGVWTPDPTTIRPITQIVAQDIQLEANLLYADVNPPGPRPITVEVGAFFSPKTHVRPDWYTKTAPFAGGETGGR